MSSCQRPFFANPFSTSSIPSSMEAREKGHIIPPPRRSRHKRMMLLLPSDISSCAHSIAVPGSRVMRKVCWAKLKVCTIIMVNINPKVNSHFFSICYPRPRRLQKRKSSPCMCHHCRMTCLPHSPLPSPSHRVSGLISMKNGLHPAVDIT